MNTDNLQEVVVKKPRLEDNSAQVQQVDDPLLPVRFDTPEEASSDIDDIKCSTSTIPDPLSLLREYNIDQKEIIERDGQIIFGEFSFSKTVLSNYLAHGSHKRVKEEYYTLETLLFFLKNNYYLAHSVYVRLSVSENIPIVHRPDRRDVRRQSFQNFVLQRA